MKNKGKSRMKKLIAAAMLVCMLTCSLDTGFVIPVLADDGTPTEQSVDLDTSDVDVLDVEPGVSDTTDTTVGDPVTDDTATNGVPTEQGETEENAPAEGGEEQTEQPEQQQDVEQPEAEQPEATQPETEQPEAEQPQTTSVSLQAEADGVKFTALNVDESFPYVSDFSNFSLTVVRSAISDVRLEDAIAETNDGDVVNLSTYDLHFFNGSNEVVPNSNVSVMVENAEILPEEGQWIQTYFYNKADGTAKKCPTQWNKSSGAVTVTVKDNGEYALAVLKTKNEIKLTAIANDVEITLTAPADAFPKEGELTLAAEEITDERLEQAKETIEEAIIGNSEISTYRLFDVTPMLDGKEVQPTKPVKVSFKNLTLTNEEGTTTDVREKLEAEGKVVTEENEAPIESACTDDEKVTAEEQIKIFHFEDENTPEEINVAADVQEVVTELDHFSWVAAVGIRDSGTPYDPGANRELQTYEAEANDPNPYSIDYILSHYNIFVSGDYLGTHVVGPMVVGGETMMNGNIGGLSHKDEGEPEYEHLAPTYLEGYAFNHTSKDMPSVITGRYDMPVYLGRSNYPKGKHDVSTAYHTNFKTPDAAYDTTEEGGKVIDQSKLYVDFEKVFPTNTMGYDAEGHIINRPKGNLPEYGINSNPATEPNQRPWNQDDSATHEPQTTDAKVPDGLLYGTKEDKGSINYYMNFDGYDANGKRVMPVHIDENLFTEILVETNDGMGKDSNGDDLTATENGKITDRQLGYIRYYNVVEKIVDKKRIYDIVPVTELNEADNNRGARAEWFDPSSPDYKPEYDKTKYAFAIDTKSTQYKGSGVVAHEDTIDVSVRLRPSFNFTFDNFETGVLDANGVKGRVRNVVYDYITDDEMSGSLTIINTIEQTEQLVIPRIYKSVRDDSFGQNYGFGSIEKGPAFSVLWTAPYVREVYVGFMDSKAVEKNGSKMVGHLAVPQADVWVAGGDFNGGIIARNVDAFSGGSGSEGHMWPFVLGTAINGIEFEGEKHVDGRIPPMQEKFFFKYEFQKKQADGSYVTVPEGRNVISHVPGGKFNLKFVSSDNEYAENNLINEAGEYRVIISELQSDEEFQVYAQAGTAEKIGYDKATFEALKSKYKFDPTIYRGDVKIVEDTGIPPTSLEERALYKVNINPNESKIRWKINRTGSTEESDFVEYVYRNEDDKIEDKVVFDNTTPKSLKVTKNWKNENGDDIETDETEVTFDLYRDSAEPTGHKVTLEIYSTNNRFSDFTSEQYQVSAVNLVKSETIGYANEGQSIKFNVQCIDNNGLWIPEKDPDDPEKEVPPPQYTKTEAAGILMDNVTVDNLSDNVTWEDTFIKTFIGSMERPSGRKYTINNISKDIVIKVIFITDDATSDKTYWGYTSIDSDNTPLYEADGITPKRQTRPDPRHFNVEYVDTGANAWSEPPFLQRVKAFKTDDDGNVQYIQDENGNYGYYMNDSDGEKIVFITGEGIKDELGNILKDQDGVPLKEKDIKFKMEDMEPYKKGLKITKGDNWITTIDGLEENDPNGNPYYYKVVENPIPAGWEASYVGNTIRIENSFGDNTKKIGIINTAKSGVALKLNKKDGAGNMVSTSNAKFQLFKKDGSTTSSTPVNFIKSSNGKYQYTTNINNVVNELETLDGVWDITYMPYGEYVLKETKAPDGFVLEKREMHITFPKTGDPTYRFYDKDNNQWTEPVKLTKCKDVHLIKGFGIDYDNIPEGGPPLPNSGGPGFRMFTIGGISFIAISLMIIYYEIARRRKEDLVQVKQTYHKNKM